MNRLHLVRGQRDKLYYCKLEGYTGVLSRIKHHPSQMHELIEDEAFRIQGEKIVAFELDVELIQEDSYEDSMEALFILTDKEKIYYI